MATPNPILRVSVQQTRSLSLLRVDDGWLLWINGSPETQHSTYLYLYDTGRIQRVTEDKASGDIRVLDVHT